MTIQVMVDDLSRRGLSVLDIDRVHTAFESLGGKIQKWPTSLMVIEALPNRVIPQTHRVSHQPQSTQDMDEVTPRLRDAITHKKKRNSVLLPNEGLGDYLRAYNQSGLTRSQFDELRLNPVKAFDPEALEERIAIQMESTYE